jgi:hypothetical protein
MTSPSPSPAVVVLHDASSQSWMVPAGFWLALATAVVGSVWAIIRFWFSGPRLKVTTSTYPDWMGLANKRAKHDWVYRVTVANKGRSSTKVHRIRLQMGQDGGIEMSAGVIGASSPMPADLAAKDMCEWIYPLAVFARGNPTGDPLRTRVRPLVNWGPSKEKKGGWRLVSIEAPKFADLSMPGTLTIGDRPDEPDGHAD